MKTNIYLVRHAHSIYNTDELNRTLSNKGYIDAKRVTNILSEERINYVISSPYKRAVETVNGISKIIDKDIIIDDRFKERVLSSSAIEDFNLTVLKAWQDLNFSLDGGECGYVAQNRGVNALKEILLKYSGKNIVVGTHGNIMALIMNYYDEKFDYLFWRNLEMPDIYKLSFENEELISINKIRS